MRMSVATPETPTPTSVVAPRDDLFSPGLQKFAFSSGIAAAVLLLVAFIVNSAEVPEFNAPAAEWAQYVDEEAGAIKLSGFLIAVAAFQLVFYAGVIRSALGEAEIAARGFARLALIVLAGLTFAAACFAIGGTTQAGFGASEGSEAEVIKVYGNVSGACFAAGAMGLAAALDAAGLVILRTRVFAAWLGWVALASSVFWFLTAFNLLDVNEDTIFGLGYPLGFLTLFVWLCGTSIALIRRV